MRLVSAKDDYARLRPSEPQLVGVPARLRSRKLPVKWRRFAERADQYMPILSVSLRYCPADSGCALTSSAATVAAGQPE